MSLRSLLYFACIVVASPAVAEEASYPYEVIVPTGRNAQELREAQPRGDAGTGFGARLDRWHDKLYMGVQNFIERTDQRFADNELEMLSVPASPFRIGSETEFVDTGHRLDFNGRLSVDFLLQLPNIEQRLRLFVTSEDVQESPDQLGRSDNGVRAGLRYSTLRYFDFDVGLRADFPDAAFASLRWQRVYQAGGWDVQPFAKVYVQTGDGIGVASGVTFDHWKNRWLVRSASYANWFRNEAATSWTQTIVVAKAREIIRFGRFGPIVRGRDISRGMGVQLLATGERTSKVDEYELSLFSKHATRKRWLYWYVAPLVRWERDNDWKTEPGIRVGIDALFWDLSDR